MTKPTLRDLIGAYWDCAYREGEEGRTHDTEEGTAQTLMRDIEAALTDLETRAALSAIPEGYSLIPSRPTQAEVNRVLPKLRGLDVGLLTSIRLHALVRTVILEGQPEPAALGHLALPDPNPPAYLFTTLKNGHRDTFAAVDFIPEPGTVIHHRVPLARVPVAPTSEEVRHALHQAEAALSDIGDAEREPGDDVAWCEQRAAAVLPLVRSALASLPEALADQPQAVPPEALTLDMIVAGQEAAQGLGWAVDHEQGPNVASLYEAMWQAAPRQGDSAASAPAEGIQWQARNSDASPWVNVSVTEAADLRAHHPKTALRGVIAWS